MGCDIHLKLERRLKKDKKHVIIKAKYDNNGKEISPEKCWIEKADKWKQCYLFGYHSVWSDRVYGMFARLNDVRNNWDIEPLEDRGFPDDATGDTIFSYSYIVVSDEDYDKNEDRYGYSSLYYTSESEANEWVKKGYSKWISNPDNKDMKLVTGPDWHSPNWCTTQEMEKAVNETFYNEDQGWHGDYEEWVALVGAMKGYEISGEYEVRAVFWFDN